MNFDMKLDPLITGTTVLCRCVVVERSRGALAAHTGSIIGGPFSIIGYQAQEMMFCPSLIVLGCGQLLCAPSRPLHCHEWAKKSPPSRPSSSISSKWG